MEGLQGSSRAGTWQLWSPQGIYLKKKNPESPGKLPGLSRAAFARILAGAVIFQVTSLSLANMFLNLYQI